MSHDLHLLFQTAAKYFYKKHRANGGGLDDLAEKLGITSTYLSAVINGSRVASLDLQIHIAQHFYGPYDRFISIGRQVHEGKEPVEYDNDKQSISVEKIIAQLTHLVMDHKRITNELKISELKFRDISLTSGDMIFEVDENLTITFLSGKVKEIVGLADHQLLGKNIFRFLEEQEWTRIAPLIEESIQSRTIFDNTIEVIRDGKTFHRHCIAKPVFSSKNDRFLGFRGTYRDITKRKNLELDLVNQTWLFQATIDAVKECAIVITDQHNKIIRWNKTYQDMMDYPQDVLEKRSLSHYFSFLRDKLNDPDSFFNGIKEVLASQKPTSHCYELKNGKTISRKVTPIFQRGAFAGRITFLTEVSKTENS